MTWYTEFGQEKKSSGFDTDIESRYDGSEQQPMSTFDFSCESIGLLPTESRSSSESLDYLPNMSLSDEAVSEPAFHAEDPAGAEEKTFEEFLEEMLRRVQDEMMRSGQSFQNKKVDFVANQLLLYLNNHSGVNEANKSRSSELLQALSNGDKDAAKILLGPSAQVGSNRILTFEPQDPYVGDYGPPILEQQSKSALGPGERVEPEISVFDEKRVSEQFSKLKDLRETGNKPVSSEELFNEVRDIVKFEADGAFKNALNNLLVVRKDGIQSFKPHLIVLYKGNPIEVAGARSGKFITDKGEVIAKSDCSYRLVVPDAQGSVVDIASTLRQLEFYTGNADWNQLTLKANIDQFMKKAVGAPPDVPVQGESSAPPGTSKATIEFGGETYVLSDLVDQAIRLKELERLRSPAREGELNEQLERLRELRVAVNKNDRNAVLELKTCLTDAVNGNRFADHQRGALKDSGFEKATGRAAAYLIVSTAALGLIAYRNRKQTPAK